MEIKECIVVLNEHVLMDSLNICLLDFCVDYIVMNGKNGICYFWNIVSCFNPRVWYFYIRILLAGNVRMISKLN
jgi:hypothetical protein